MKSPPNKQRGLIAVLDALGAASYGDREVQEFLKSRERALQLLGQKAEGVLGPINQSQVKIFTFNDTIVIAFTTNSSVPDLKQISDFFTILRKFLVDSLCLNILFRGSVAIGTFYADDESNTVMGQAVSDAAAWYDKADWIGIQATPRTTIIIQSLVERAKDAKAHLMLDYNVPLKDGKTVRVKTVNWPKVFFVQSITPCETGEKPREKLFQLLAKYPVPIGTERKYFNTVAFFDDACDVIKKEFQKKLKRKSASSSPTNVGRAPT